MYINVRENRMGSQDRIIHRHISNIVHKTQSEDKQNENTTTKTKMTSNTDHIKNRR